MEKDKKTYFSIVLALMLLFVSTSKVNINHAKIISPDYAKDMCSKEFAYTFKVSDKLDGKGEILLSIENNLIKGKATGLGMTCQCNIDFETTVQGKVDDLNGKINIAVNGIGDPLGIPLPGKVTFQGPLEGYLKDGKVFLAGKVNIKGCLAHYAGFNKVEDLLIEIPDSSLAKAFKELQSRKSLASL